MAPNSKPAPRPTSIADKTAALRQQRRRDKLKELELQKVFVLLDKDQIKRIDRIVALGYAKDRSAALVKALEEVSERMNSSHA